MIRFDNLSKIYTVNGVSKVVIQPITIDFPTGCSVALMGRNGAGKSTLLRLVAGTEAPTTGRILSTGSISYPVGYSGSFHADLTGAQNTRFVARLYGADTDELLKFVEEFAELGNHFHLPLRTYSSGMKSRLSFGVSMGIPFDTYLVDEVTAVGDATFRKKSSEMFLDRMDRAGAFFVTHSTSMIRRLCNHAIVLEDGRLNFFEDIEEAIAFHTGNMQADMEG